MSSLDGQPDSRWWRSLDELADSPEFRAFLEAEFPAEADPGGISRRRWIQLMGASLALAAAAGCWKKQDILPFAERPEGYTPGQFVKYATAMPLGDVVQPLEVTCVDGRPIKIDGNPRHPESRGASSVFAQAALLELYDPDRSGSVVQKNGDKFEEQTWEKIQAESQKLFRRLHESEGEGFRVLAEADSSPTLDALRKRLLKAFPKAKWFEYEPLSDDNERAGATAALERPLRTQLRLDRANVIVCLDADPLDSHPAAVRYARDFAAGRDPESGRMSRLYVVESSVSLTGAAADHRLPLRASKIPGFVESLEQELKSRIEKLPSPNGRGVGGEGSEGKDGISKEGAPHPNPLPKGEGTDPFLRAMVADLLKPENRGRSVVCTGPAQPPEVHAAVHRINALLENVGEEKQVAYARLPDPDRLSNVSAVQRLVGEMKAGKVDTLLIIGGNPVYNAPADLAFGDALDKVNTTIHLNLYRNETSRCCTWHLPRAHFLESWGDGRAYDGTYSVIQPMIAPLRNGRSAIEVLAMIWEYTETSTEKTAKPEALVQQTFNDLFGKDSKASWQRTVRDGLLVDSRWPIESIKSSAATPHPNPLPEGEGTNGTLDIIFRGSRTLYDGRFANNGWLQELPDPVTKLTWDNAALIGPGTGKILGLENGDIVVLKIEGQELQTPVYIQPGQAEQTIELTLGYGRRAAGKVGGESSEVEPVGVDAYPLRTTQSMYLAAGATITRTGKKFQLAGTQDHFAIDAVGRAATKQRVKTLIRQTSLAQFKKHPDFARDKEHPPLKSLWTDLPYEGHRWGMAIDLSKCIGCGACVVACQAENNVPVVGKEQVMKGRIMHWVRVDRYYRGEPENPEVAFQPLPCQQCELAPCEQVCPVAATVHSREGLNDMVYNRCVGTRYCANNCPYKVRRFNYFNYHKEFEQPGNEIAKMKYNPEVTVRSRGVMEKCTYCVQRIQAAKIAANVSGGKIPDGEIRTACQQVCPTGAIVFGDLADPQSAVRKLHAQDRAYVLLDELNIRPRTAYLARIRNPNRELELKDIEAR